MNVYRSNCIQYKSQFRFQNTYCCTLKLYKSSRLHTFLMTQRNALMFMEAWTTQHLYTEQNAQNHPLINYILSKYDDIYTLWIVMRWYKGSKSQWSPLYLTEFIMQHLYMIKTSPIHCTKADYDGMCSFWLMYDIQVYGGPLYLSFGPLHHYCTVTAAHSDMKLIVWVICSDAFNPNV